MAGWKSSLPLIGPALALAAAGLIWWLAPPASPRPKHIPGEAWTIVEFSRLKPGDTIPGWDVVRGGFSLVGNDGRTVLALQPEPMAEGNLTSGQLLAGGGAVRARLTGERIRRAAPRFAISLNGDTEYHLRAVPSGGVLEIVTGTEQVLASVPWKWQPDRWLWLELRIRPTPSAGGMTIEGRAWPDGDIRPDAPAVQVQSGTLPGILRAAIRGAPFALRPIYCDRIETLRIDPEPLPEN